MSLEFEGLTEFQRDLLQMAQRTLPRETKKIMRKIGSKARTQIAKEARSKVKKQDNVYHKRFKRGKVFKDGEGKIVVRVINSAPHAHLIEYGHRQVLNPPKTNGRRGVIPGKGIGEEIGFVPGKKVMDHGMANFDNSGQFERMLSDWLDGLLESGDL